MRRIAITALSATVSLAALNCGGMPNQKQDAGTGGGSGFTNFGGGVGNTGGGENTGGGAGGGGGGGATFDAGTRSDAGCLVIDMIPTSRTDGADYQTDDGGYNFWTAYIDAQNPDTAPNRYDLISIELWHDLPTPPTFPTSGAYTATTQRDCYDCAFFSQGCDDTGDNCQATYFARGGTVSYTAGTPSFSAGTFSGSASNVRFEEWNEATDQLVPGGRCIQVSSIQFNASWP